MITVWKYGVPIDAKFQVDMPEGAKVLHVQTQQQEPYMWVLVDDQAKKVTRAFYVRGTGHDIDIPSPKHLGSFQMNYGQYMFHLFESRIA